MRLDKNYLKTQYEESLGITPVFDDTEAVVCRELRYKGLVLARMTRTGYVYKFEALFLRKERSRRFRQNSLNHTARGVAT
jgi:hypothetical protein